MSPTTTWFLPKYGPYCYLTVTPAANQAGTTTITVTVNNGTNTTTETFPLTVTAIPLLSKIPDQLTSAGVATSATLPFRLVASIIIIGGRSTISATSSNSSLVSDDGIDLEGSGADRTITVTPTAAMTGAATITVTANYGTYTNTSTFAVVVPALDGALAI